MPYYLGSGKVFWICHFENLVYSSFNLCFYLLYLLLKFSVSPGRFVLSNKCPWIQAKISDIWQIVINIYYPCCLVAGGEGGALSRWGGGGCKKNCKKNTISRVSHHEIIHFVFSKINYFQLWLSHNSKWPARIVRMKHFSVQKIGVKWNSVDSPFHEKFGKRYFKYVSIIFLEKNSWKLVKMWICL